MTDTSLNDRLIAGLDKPSIEAAQAVIDAAGDAVSFYKIGLQLLPIGGPELARRLKAAGKKVFLDFKLHDIPDTVERATRSIATLGADFLTVHAEPPVMRAAVRGRSGNLRLLAVTVLTAYDDAMLAEMGYSMGARDLVMKRVGQALDAGMDGVVASPLEAADIRARYGSGFDLVTPGVRMAGAPANDQARVATPADALRAGATHIVMARPICDAADPRAAALAVLKEMAGA